MRFRKETHKPGTIRYLKRFAFRPKLIKGSYLWLERYVEKQHWCEYFNSWRHVAYLLPEDIELAPLNRALE